MTFRLTLLSRDRTHHHSSSIWYMLRNFQNDTSLTFDHYSWLWLSSYVTLRFVCYSAVVSAGANQQTLFWSCTPPPLCTSFVTAHNHTKAIFICIAVYNIIATVVVNPILSMLTQILCIFAHLFPRFLNICRPGTVNQSLCHIRASPWEIARRICCMGNLFCPHCRKILFHDNGKSYRIEMVQQR